MLTPFTGASRDASTTGRREALAPGGSNTGAAGPSRPPPSEVTSPLSAEDRWDLPEDEPAARNTAPPPLPPPRADVRPADSTAHDPAVGPTSFGRPGDTAPPTRGRTPQHTMALGVKAPASAGVPGANADRTANGTSDAPPRIRGASPPDATARLYATPANGQSAPPRPDAPPSDPTRLRPNATIVVTPQGVAPARSSAATAVFNPAVTAPASAGVPSTAPSEPPSASARRPVSGTVIGAGGAGTTPSVAPSSAGVPLAPRRAPAPTLGGTAPTVSPAGDPALSGTMLGQGPAAAPPPSTSRLIPVATDVPSSPPPANNAVTPTSEHAADGTLRAAAIAAPPAPTAVARLELAEEPHDNAARANRPAVAPASQPPAPRASEPRAAREPTPSPANVTGPSIRAAVVSAHGGGDLSGARRAASAATTSPNPAVTTTQRQRLVLASEVLREDLVPHEPGGKALRGLLLLAGAALCLAAGARGLSNANALAAWAIPGLTALVVAAAPMPYATRALLAFAPALPALAVQALSVPGASLFSALVFTATVAALPASLLFRANFRASRRARWFVAAAIAIGATWLLLEEGGGLLARAPAGTGWAVSHLPALGLVPVLLLSMLAFMGSNTSAGCRAWAALAVAWAGFAMLAPTLATAADGAAPARFTPSLLVTPASVSALGAIVASTVAALLAVYARPSEPVTGIGVAATAPPRPIEAPRASDAPDSLPPASPSDPPASTGA